MCYAEIKEAAAAEASYELAGNLERTTEIGKKEADYPGCFFGHKYVRSILNFPAVQNLETHARQKLGRYRSGTVDPPINYNVQSKLFHRMECTC